MNFDDTFVDGALAVQESIPIYSIVNSLIDACQIKQVQISVVAVIFSGIIHHFFVDFFFKDGRHNLFILVQIQ